MLAAQIQTRVAAVGPTEVSGMRRGLRAVVGAGPTMPLSTPSKRSLPAAEDPVRLSTMAMRSPTFDARSWKQATILRMHDVDL